MCGLAGILHWERRNDSVDRTRSMVAAMRHRGPDDEGYWSSAQVAFGFARLSIVDIEQGAQPMTDADATLVVVFNGEIYNHRELRRRLEAKGHVFKTDHSDTEVLLHGYKEWGPDLVLRLNGMFAFGLWDARAERLLIARDRLGIKPLYSARSRDGSVVLASEVRAVLASGLIEKQACAAGILEYLSLQNFWSGRTPFVGIELFPAGHYEIHSRAGSKRIRYWDMEFPRSLRVDLADAAGKHRSILKNAVSAQLDADVAVVSYLSGGIDSSAVCAAAKSFEPDMRAYSCIFDLTDVGADRIVDEREHSRAVASHLGIDRIELQLRGDVLVDSLDATIDALEYPRMGMAYVNYLIAERVSRDAKVVLSGMGGDEVHGGYLGRYQMVTRDRHNKGLLARLFDLVGTTSQRQADPLEQYRSMLNFPLSVNSLDDALTPEFLQESQGFDPMGAIQELIAAAPSKDPWDVVMYVDAKTYLHGLLVMEDKLSMIHSLETRVPLLDNDLVDFVLDLPWELLCDGRAGKLVFRESVKPWVPDEIFEKPKMGFGPPDASWYRGPLRNWVNAVLDRRIVAERGIFQPAFVEKVLTEHFSGNANHTPMIWSMLSLETWCRQHDFYGGRALANDVAVGDVSA